jgi:hypothetical protein
VKLPRGATGFGPPVANPREGFHALLHIAHHVAYRTNGTLSAADPAGPTPNFHTAVLSYPDR